MAARFPISFSENNLKDMECPVCLRIPSSAPIFQCGEGGHIVCKECHPKLVNCPVCRKPLGNSRNRIFEMLVLQLPYKCKFSQYGCPVEVMSSDLESHEPECQHRLVHCLYPICKKVPFASYMGTWPMSSLQIVNKQLSLFKNVNKQLSLFKNVNNQLSPFKNVNKQLSFFSKM